jgi:hypothetical protein
MVSEASWLNNSLSLGISHDCTIVADATTIRRGDGKILESTRLQPGHPYFWGKRLLKSITDTISQLSLGSNGGICDPC